MKKKNDKQLNPPEFPDELEGIDQLLEGAEAADVSLDEILAEFSDRAKRTERRAAQKATQPVVLLPDQDRQPPEPPRPSSKPARPAVVAFPDRGAAEQKARPEAPSAPKDGQDAGRKPPAKAAAHKPSGPERPAEEKTPPPDNVIPLWEEPENPVKAGFDYLMRRADEYADTMFEAEDTPDPDGDIAEKYIPGTDEEAPPKPRAKPHRERPPRPAPPPPPDTPPDELAKTYTRGLNSLRLRTGLVFLLSLPLLYLNVAQSFHLPLPPLPLDAGLWLPLALCGGLAAAALLGLDALAGGLADLFRGRPGLHTVGALAVLATLGDGAWYVILGREGPLPLCGLSALGLACWLWGMYLKRKGLRLTCRTAAAAAEPYLVTRDEAKWNGRGTFTKHPGTVEGFGSQVQGLDGAQRICRRASPLLLLAGLLFALLSSVGRGQPERLVWCLSVILTAGAPLGALLSFSLPFSKLSLRLSQAGAALAGWDGVEAMAGQSGILITDSDLFPPGSVKLNGIKIFGDWPVEKVVGVTASLIRDSGCGLEKIFHDLLRTQGAIFRRTSDFCCYEGGGLSAVIRGEQVLVGSASFMGLMEVALPQGLNVKNAVFCAIEGELAGIFALSYSQPATVRPALTALIRNKVAPVLATRDFNIIPAMLQQRFKLPADRMEFPPIERRVELSVEHQSHSPVMSALLCREGLNPFSDAVVGGRRLRRVVRANAVLGCLASAAGVLLGFYLTYVSAYASLSPGNMLVFLVMWLIPTLLLSLSINQY